VSVGRHSESTGRSQVQAGALGLLLGGILTSYVSWRWTLFVNLAFAAIAIVGTLLWLKSDDGADPRSPRSARPIPGLWWAICDRLRLFACRNDSLAQSLTVGFLVAGVVLLAVFAYIETRAKYPLLPPRVCAQPNARRIIVGDAFSRSGSSVCFCS